MAINILFGPGGSGKSYYQMRIILEELRYSNRNICTNLALNVPKLAEYCERHFPKESLRVAHRVRVLTLPEIQEFWNHRGPVRIKADLMEEPVEKVDPGEQGCAFIIDEAGACGFSAKAWAASVGRTTRGEQCIWYLDQQRKFTDNVYASTNGRTPAGIAKDFRDKAHNFIKLKNGYLKSFGMFRARGRFTALHYTGEPGAGMEAHKVEHWELDPTGLADCYRTQDGMGVTGNMADKGARAKGIPILWSIPIWIAVASLIVVIPMLLSKLLVKQQAATVPQVQQVAGSNLAEGGPVDTWAKTSAAASGVECIGTLIIGKEAYVELSDGRRFTHRDRELEMIEPGRVRIAGEWIPNRRARLLDSRQSAPLGTITPAQ